MRRSGHTLIELLIAQALLGIVLLGIAALAKAGGRYLLVTEAKTTLQRGAILCARHMANEFSETNDGSFTVGNSTADPNTCANFGVVFANPRNPTTGQVDYDDIGRLLWPKFVCLYKHDVHGVSCIVRAVDKLDHRLPYPPPAEPIDTFLSTPRHISIVCRNVTVFECWKDSANLLMLLQVELPSNYGKNYGFQIQTQVFARN